MIEWQRDLSNTDSLGLAHGSWLNCFSLLECGICASTAFKLSRTLSLLRHSCQTNFWVLRLTLLFLKSKKLTENCQEKNILIKIQTIQMLLKSSFKSLKLIP